jgi:hypothetical protein
VSEERFRFTTFRWANQLNDVGKYSKVPLMRRGFAYADFACGTDTPEQWRPFRPADAPVQIGLICSPQTGLLVIDIDDPDEYADTRTAGLLGRDDAMSTRGAGFHIGIDMRGIPPARWPRQGKIPGADIKAAGFVPVPSSLHWRGEPYAPRWDADGLPRLVPVTEKILGVLRADRGAFYAEPRGGGGPGGRLVNGMDHDTARAGTVMRGVLAGWPLDSIYAAWAAMPDHGPECTSSSGFTNADFQRHYDGAVRRAPRYRAEQADWWARCLRQVTS